MCFLLLLLVFPLLIQLCPLPALLLLPQRLLQMLLVLLPLLLLLSSSPLHLLLFLLLPSASHRATPSIAKAVATDCRAATTKLAASVAALLLAAGEALVPAPSLRFNQKLQIEPESGHDTPGITISKPTGLTAKTQ